MCTNKNIYGSVRSLFFYACLFRRSPESGKQLDLYREAGVAGAERVVVLLSQYRCRNKKCALFAVHRAFECSTQRDLGFAVANVAAKQPVHYFIRFHIGLYLLNACQLIRSFAIRKAEFQSLLPIRILRKAEALASCAFAVKFHKVKCKFAHARPRSCNGFLPLTGAEF